MTEYKVVVCTKENRSVRNPRPKLSWRGECVAANNAGEALDACRKPYAGNSKVRSYVAIYARNSWGLIQVSMGKGDMDLGEELHNVLREERSFYKPGFPWHRDEHTS